MEVVELKVRKHESKNNLFNSYFIDGNVNLKCVALIRDKLDIIDTILNKYSQNKLKTCFEFKRNVFKLAISRLGIDWKEQTNGVYFHKSGFYDKKWILFNLHEIVWDNQDKTIG